MPEPNPTISPTPGVRLPRQARAQETFDRVLTTGAELVAAEGFAGLSLQEICRRANVSTGALYARVESMDALALAIHDREFARMALEHEAFDPSARWTAMSCDQLILRSVSELGAHYARHAGLLRAFILRSSVDKTMHQRGLATTEALSVRLCGLWSTRVDELPHPEPEAAIQAAYRIVHASLNWRVAFGPRLTSNADAGWEQHVHAVAAAARAYLRTPPIVDAE
jgi:AcrR family transcriptional regulator